MIYSSSVEGKPQKQMREWLSGGASPCQGEGRGFESRLALFLCPDSDYTVRVFLFIKQYIVGCQFNINQLVPIIC